MPQSVDLVIHPRWVIPIEPDSRPRTDHSVVVNRGRIVSLLARNLCHERFLGREEVQLPHHALLPGFVNAHTHAAMTLFRGMADDMPLMEWLSDHIWPAEKRWVSEQFVRAGTRLAIAEMLCGGTTCFNDMYFFPNIVAEVAEQQGIRVKVGLIMIDFPTPWAQSPDDYLAKGLRLHDDVKASQLVSTAFAPHAPYSVSDEPLHKIQVLADELDIPVHMHVHETVREVEESLGRYQVRPLERLSRLNLLTDRLLAVHMTQLLGSEIDAMAQLGAHVVHCPESNLKLASGSCPVADLSAAGVNIALGTDGAASNNDLDMLGEMRSAALHAKGQSNDPTALPADQALAMATINGARALRLDHQVGSIVPGKAADLIAVNLDSLATQPVYDPVTQIVYSAGRDQISDVWVNGRRAVHNGELRGYDRKELLDEVNQWQRQIQQSDQSRVQVM
jgi:5-methylthioadenosine/S-adenosylhomocysteine deaminase